MFRHEVAPACTNLTCKITKCQFTHTVVDKDDITAQTNNHLDDKEDNLDDEKDIANCKQFIHCGAKENHPNDNIQHCSECDFNSKCFQEYKIHWQRTPDYIFSTEQLREMGYDVLP